VGTFVDGIGASQNIDSSGEIVDISGLDISSLEVDGSLNWEHKKDVPDQLVGKILKAKKIFSDKDCEDDRQKYFWEKCKVPYLYVLGELFDDYTDSARTVAGLFRYDLDHRGKNAKDIIGFSVEGATIHKNGNTITRSIARKITCTSLPCNKMAVAEMVPKEGKKPKDNLSNIFKTESYVEIEVINIPKQSNIWEMLKAESLMKRAKAMFAKPVKKDEMPLSSGQSSGLSGSAPSSPSLSLSEPDMAKSGPPKLSVAKQSSLGTHLGNTTSGKPVHSHAQVGQTGFSAQDHTDAAALHHKAAKNTKDMALGTHHANKHSLHTSAAKTVTLNARKVAARRISSAAHTANFKRSESTGGASAGLGSATSSSSSISIGATQAPKVPNPKPKIMPVGKITKALEAGSSLTSPANLTGGAALGKESLDRKMHKGGQFSGNVPKDAKIKELQGKIDSGKYKPDPKAIAGKMLTHKDKPLKKSEALQRAEAEYSNWSKREEFEKFMKSRMPHMTKGEIIAFGQAMLLNKSTKMEKSLNGLLGLLKEEPKK
jgi:anti-sigma28 factor (negative regulator of flagellin synthesis)